MPDAANWVNVVMSALGAGGTVAAVLSFLQSRQRTAAKVSIESQRLGLEAATQQERHYQAVIAEYKELLGQRERASAWVREEVHALRNELGVVRQANQGEILQLKAELKAVRAAHERCNAENEAILARMEQLQGEFEMMKAASAPSSLTP